jgi:hypothetical protein
MTHDLLLFFSNLCFASDLVAQPPFFIPGIAGGIAGIALGAAGGGAIIAGLAAGILFARAAIIAIAGFTDFFFIIFSLLTFPTF